MLHKTLMSSNEIQPDDGACQLMETMKLHGWIYTKRPDVVIPQNPLANNKFKGRHMMIHLI